MSECTLALCMFAGVIQLSMCIRYNPAISNTITTKVIAIVPIWLESKLSGTSKQKVIQLRRWPTTDQSCIDIPGRGY